MLRLARLRAGLPALLLGALVLSESLTVLQYAGIGVVILGIVLAERRSRSASAAAPPQIAAAE